MTTEPSNISAEDARQALQSVNEMERAGWRRSVPPKWFSVANAVIIVLIVASFAFENEDVVFGAIVPLTKWQAGFIGLCLAIAAAMWVCRESLTAYSWGIPRSSGEWLDTSGYLAGFTLLVITSFVSTRFFDLVWVSLVMSAISGLWTYSWLERERRRSLTRAQEGKGASHDK